VAEIHRYPLRPEGFEEPLFPTRASKRAVGEHLLGAPWLARASEFRSGTGESAHALREPVEVEASHRGVCVVQTSGGRCFRKKARVSEVLDRWREVGDWWDEDIRVDRVVFRVLLSDGSVMDLARERAEGWFLVGVVD
jgi:hypothetical protein